MSPHALHVLPPCFPTRRASDHAAARGADGAPDGPPLGDAGGWVERVIGRYRGLSRERGIELIGSIAIGLPAIETSEEVLERVVGRLFAAVIGAARAEIGRASCRDRVCQYV